MRHILFVPLLLALGCQNDYGMYAVPDVEPERPEEETQTEEGEETNEEAPPVEDPECENGNENEPPGEDPPEDEEEPPLL